MASTYSSNLGIEQITTGEQSGSWGTTSNYNWSIIDRLRGYSTVAISGTTHTLQVAASSPTDGASHVEEGMYQTIAWTGGSGSAVVTIAPNTVKMNFFMVNSSSYQITFKQGTGTTAILPAGKDAVIYCDGIGAAANVAFTLNDLYTATLQTTGLITAGDGLTVTGAPTFNTPIPVTSGGTGKSSITAGDVLYSNGANSITSLAIGTAGQLLEVNAGATAPTWTTRTDFVTPGAITMYGATSAPTGYLLCDGAAVSRSTYSVLFGIVSTTVGTGDGSSTFNVPNLQSRFPIGYDGGASYGLGTTGGATSVTPNITGTVGNTALTEAQLPSHAHDAPVTGFSSGTWSGGTGSSVSAVNTGSTAVATGATLRTLATGSGSTHTHSFSGTSNSVGIIPSYISLNYIIKT